MGALNDTKRTSRLVIKEPYMGLVKETKSWMDLNYSNMCINACWELYGATSLSRFPSTGSRYHLQIEKPSRDAYRWIDRWDQDEGGPTSCARSTIHENHGATTQEVVWNVSVA